MIGPILDPAFEKCLGLEAIVGIADSQLQQRTIDALFELDSKVYLATSPADALKKNPTTCVSPGGDPGKLFPGNHATDGLSPHGHQKKYFLYGDRRQFGNRQHDAKLCAQCQPGGQ